MNPRCKIRNYATNSLEGKRYSTTSPSARNLPINHQLDAGLRVDQGRFRLLVVEHLGLGRRQTVFRPSSLNYLLAL
jgi:hypothetical protein